MALTPEKITELKQIIHTQLLQKDVQGKIKDTLSEFLRDDQANQLSEINQSTLLQRLRQKGVIDDVMQHLEFGHGGESTRNAIHWVNKDDKLTLMDRSIKKANIDPNRRYLYFQILSGRAFLDHLDQNIDSTNTVITSTFTLHIHFRSQRFKSQAIPCACDPEFKEGFLLELHKEHLGETSRMLDATSLLSICDPIHLVLIRTDGLGDTTLVASKFYEWRTVLTARAGHQCSSIELFGAGKECKVPVGLLEVQLELFPRIEQSLKEEVVTTQLSMERTKQAEKERLFLVYAKQWWKEYQQIRDSHVERMVKIFAQDENVTCRPVCSFVKPLRCGRLLDTPRQAARFVSLVKNEKVATIGGGERTEQWTTMHTFLCRNRGDCEDHAVRLCSLLLGFGLDTCVCVGTKNQGAVVTWVMSISTDNNITF